jgi:hypothetical protein
MASGSIVAPVSALLRSRFDDLNIESIDIDVASIDGTQLATIDRLTVDRSEVKAGETIEVQAFARTNSGKIYVQRIPITIPKDTPAGELKLIVGDGTQVTKDSAAQHFVPKDLGELVSVINTLKSSDRLFAVATRSSRGVVIGASDMPNLPPSMLATLNSERSSGGVKPVVQTVVFEKLLPPSEFIITGQQSLSLEVVR